MSARYGYDYDLIVLGSGAGGGVAAHAAAAAGKKVAIFEPAEIGGECPNWGCVPTKSLLHAAHTYNSVRQSKQYGISVGSIKLDYAKVNAWRDLVVSRTGTSEGQELLEDDNITVIRKFARFIDPHTVTADKRHYSARRFLIATGTHPSIPPIPGLVEATYLTHKDAGSLTKLPKSIFIIGGGPIGTEFAQLFSDFGSKVTIAEARDNLIPLEDPEIGQLVAAIFNDRGIEVLTSSQITRINQSGSKTTVHYLNNGVEYTKVIEQLLVATGMTPNTDIGLENAGVEYDRRGITTNHFMQTSAKHIYAAGDIVGPYQFTHMAAYQSRIAAHNMFHRKPTAKSSYRAVPRCVFTEPEVAACGLNQSMAKEQGVAIRIGVATLDMIGRSNTSNNFTGFAKVLVDQKTGKIVGASIVSPRAGELIHELVLAIQLGATPAQVAQTIHAFPTFSELVKLACLDAQK